MESLNKRRISTKQMVLAAIMTALVIVFQLLASAGAFFGPFSTAMALIPIVVGAAMCGIGVGGWLGFVFGMVVLLSGGANLFLAVDIPGTIITVLVKGTACGLAAAAVYKLFEKFDRYVAVLAASIVGPIVNTGLFLLGCIIFFMDDVPELASQLQSTDTGLVLFWGMAMGNFIFELAINVLLSPVIVRILDIRKKSH